MLLSTQILTALSKKICTSLCILWLGICCAAHPVLALGFHTQYTHSDPVANAHLQPGKVPAAVRVWFYTSLEPRSSYLAVYNIRRQRVDLDDSHVASDGASLRISLHKGLPDGVYTVVFHNVSQATGHAATSSFFFVVGATVPPHPDAFYTQHTHDADHNFNPWSIGLRWLNYLGMAGLIGGLLFLLLVWRPVMVQLVGQVGPEFRQVRQLVRVHAAWFMLGSLVIIAVASIAFLFYEASIDSDAAPWLVVGNHVLPNLLVRSRFGITWLFRFLLIFIAFVLWLLVRQNLLGSKGLGDKLWGLLLVTGIAIMFTTALNSHAANRRDLWYMLPADVLHLICAGFWIGALLLLALILPRALGAFAPGTGDRSRLLSALIPRFSFVSMISIILLSITGIIEAIVDISAWQALWISSYGQILLIKLAIMISLLCLLSYHLLYISPRMRVYARVINEQEAHNVPGSRKIQRAFTRIQKTEALLAFCMLLSVGALTSLNPAWPAALSLPNSVTYQGIVSDLSYEIAINPSKPGPNTFEVILKDRTGQPLKENCTVFLRAIMLDMDIGVEQIALQPVPGSSGFYTTYSDILSMAGRWQMTLMIHRTGFADIKKNIIFSMNV